MSLSLPSSCYAKKVSNKHPLVTFQHIFLAFRGNPVSIVLVFIAELLCRFVSFSTDLIIAPSKQYSSFLWNLEASDKPVAHSLRDPGAVSSKVFHYSWGIHHCYLMRPLFLFLKRLFKALLDQGTFMLQLNYSFHAFKATNFMLSYKTCAIF